MTVQTGIDVAYELTLEEALWTTRGDSFTLLLMVNMPYNPTTAHKPLDIIVDRVHRDAIRQHANGDRFVDTTARRAFDGESFRITIMFQLEQMTKQGACVLVSKDMEWILLQENQRDLESFSGEGK